MHDIKVSVICLAYNHEKYIRECLDSILNQKTTFRYEVVIHDDASTDNTANIIQLYEKKISRDNNGNIPKRKPIFKGRCHYRGKNA